MFAWFCSLLAFLLDAAERQRAADYLEDSADIATLEARMKLLEAERSWW
jgi:hypothetical protein